MFKCLLIGGVALGRFCAHKLVLVNLNVYLGALEEEWAKFTPTLSQLNFISRLHNCEHFVLNETEQNFL